MLTFSEQQSEILLHTGSCLITGVPGGGKTLLLVEKAARLAQAAEEDDMICVIGFSFRATQFLKGLFEKKYKKLSGKVRFATIRDIAAEQLTKSGTQLQFADNAQVRTLLREVMEKEGFGGSLDEAEHVIRTFRSQLKNPAADEPYAGLFNRYKHMLDQMGMIDRHAIIRQHIIGMDNGTVALSPAKYMLVDNIQDATPLQFRWLQSHMAAGATLIMAGNDDLTAFGRDGAMGTEIFERFQKKNGVKVFTLAESYRTPPEVWPAVNKLPRLLKHRCPKKEKTISKHKGQLQVQVWGTQAEEMTAVVAWLEEWLKSNNHGRVGIVVRQNEQAARLVHLLRLRGINPASYARPIWENSAATAVMDLLYVLLGQADTSQLMNVMSFMGVPVDVQAQLVEEGLKASDWLAKGAPLPADLSGDKRHLVAFRRSLLGCWQVLQQKKLNPREAFKALAFDMLQNLTESDRRLALLALDTLLNIKGNMQQVLTRIRQETLPDMKSRVVVAPVREVRNMEFAMVILPFAEASHWPNQQEQLLGVDEEAERRLFYLAASRSRGDVLCTYSGTLSPFVQEMQNSLKSQKKAR